MEKHVYAPATKVMFRIQADDSEGDALTIRWDLRKDESDNPSTGGDWEQRIPPIEDAIISTESDRVTVRMPAKPGNYRLFAYVSDPSGKVATANLPMQVE